MKGRRQPMIGNKRRDGTRFGSFMCALLPRSRRQRTRGKLCVRGAEHHSLLKVGVTTIIIITEYLHSRYVCVRNSIILAKMRKDKGGIFKMWVKYRVSFLWYALHVSCIVAAASWWSGLDLGFRYYLAPVRILTRFTLKMRSETEAAPGLFLVLVVELLAYCMVGDTGTVGTDRQSDRQTPKDFFHDGKTGGLEGHFLIFFFCFIFNTHTHTHLFIGGAWFKIRRFLFFSFFFLCVWK